MKKTIQRMGALTLLMGTVLCDAQLRAPMARLQGRVELEGKRGPLPGAAVMAYRLERTATSNGPRWAGRAFAEKDGSYSIGGLLGGLYIVCVEASGSDLVSACDWTEPPVVVVPDGTTVTGIDRTVEFGRLIEIEVDDPGGHLEANEKPGRGVHLLAGVWGPNRRFHAARVTRSDKKSRTYSVVAPFDTPVGLDVRGRKLDLDDDKGKAKKDTDAPEMLTEARSASRAAKKVVIKVKGVKP